MIKQEDTFCMTCIVTYNILAGGYSLREQGARRTQQLTKIIRSAQPDIVGVVEATHPKLPEKPLVIEELAEALDMQLIMGGQATFQSDYQLALLTRLPVIYTKIHPRPALLSKPLLEVCVEEKNGQQLTVFVTHLFASFHKGWAGNALREREVQEILGILAPLREERKAHLLIGDFNSLSPGDPFKASHLVRYIVNLDEELHKKHPGDGHPQLDVVVPPQLRFVHPLLRIIPRSKLFCSVFDAIAAFYAPRGCIKILRAAGYIDSFRHAHPYERGFTCPATMPAGRIDYIFASPDLGERLKVCNVITEGEDGLLGSHASDHLAVAVELSVGVSGTAPSSEYQSILVQ
jgi:endonuclease/exonuclease/phosphatase family metal-dependent hydrolase